MQIEFNHLYMKEGSSGNPIFEDLRLVEVRCDAEGFYTQEVPTSPTLPLNHPQAEMLRFSRGNKNAGSRTTFDGEQPLLNPQTSLPSLQPHGNGYPSGPAGAAPRSPSADCRRKKKHTKAHKHTSRAKKAGTANLQANKPKRRQPSTSRSLLKLAPQAPTSLLKEGLVSEPTSLSPAHQRHLDRFERHEDQRGTDTAADETETDIEVSSGDEGEIDMPDSFGNALLN